MLLQEFTANITWTHIKTYFPILSIFMIATVIQNLFYTAQSQLILQQMCLELNFPANCSHSSAIHNASEFTMWFSFLPSILHLVSTGILSATSNRLGRKHLLLITISGFIILVMSWLVLYSIPHIINEYHEFEPGKPAPAWLANFFSFYQRHWRIFITMASVCFNACGHLSIMWLSIFGILTDISMKQSHKRFLLFLLMDVVSAACTIAGNQSAASLLAYDPSYLTGIVTGGLFFLAFIVAGCFTETLPTELKYEPIQWKRANVISIISIIFPCLSSTRKILEEDQNRIFYKLQQVYLRSMNSLVIGNDFSINKDFSDVSVAGTFLSTSGSGMTTPLLQYSMQNIHKTHDEHQQPSSSLIHVSEIDISTPQTPAPYKGLVAPHPQLVNIVQHSTTTKSPSSGDAILSLGVQRTMRNSTKPNTPDAPTKSPSPQQSNTGRLVLTSSQSSLTPFHNDNHDNTTNKIKIPTIREEEEKNDDIPVGGAFNVPYTYSDPPESSLFMTQLSTNSQCPPRSSSQTAQRSNFSNHNNNLSNEHHEPLLNPRDSSISPTTSSHLHLVTSPQQTPIISRGPEAVSDGSTLSSYLRSPPPPVNPNDNTILPFIPQHLPHTNAITVLAVTNILVIFIASGRSMIDFYYVKQLFHITPQAYSTMLMLAQVVRCVISLFSAPLLRRFIFQPNHERLLLVFTLILQIATTACLPLCNAYYQFVIILLANTAFGVCNNSLIRSLLTAQVSPGCATLHILTLFPALDVCTNMANALLFSALWILTESTFPWMCYAVFCGTLSLAVILLVFGMKDDFATFNLRTMMNTEYCNIITAEQQYKLQLEKYYQNFTLLNIGQNTPDNNQNEESASKHDTISAKQFGFDVMRPKIQTPLQLDVNNDLFNSQLQQTLIEQTTPQQNYLYETSTPFQNKKVKPIHQNQLSHDQRHNLLINNQHVDDTTDYYLIDW